MFTLLRVFGSTLQQSPLTEDQTMPIIIATTVQYLNLKAPETEGIFRISGSIAEIDKLMRQFCTGKKVDLTDADPHVVADVLKTYLRELADPLLTFALHNDWKNAVAAALSAGHSVNDTALKSLIQKLPPLNFNVLYILCGLLKKVSNFEQKNKMSITNLVICLAPNIMRSADNSLEVVLGNQPYACKVLQYLVENFDQMFGQ